MKPSWRCWAWLLAALVAGGVQAQEATSGGGGTSGGSTGGSTSGASGGTSSGGGILGPAAPSSFGGGGFTEPTLPSSGSTTPGAASSFGAPAPPSDSAPVTTPNIPTPTGVNRRTGLRSAPATGAPASNTLLGPEGTGSESAPTPQLTSPAAPTFVVPSAYGQAAQSFSAGQGRLGLPRHRYTSSLMFGFDDNVLSTPYDGPVVEEVTQEVITRQATPDQTVRERVPQRGRGSIAFGPRPQFRDRVIKGQKEKRETIVIQPRIEAEKPVSSFVVRATAGYQFQLSTRRTVFTMDLNGSASYIPNRPGDQEDFNGSLSMVYAHRLSPRAQLSATLSASYLSQPDISRVNTPTNNVGDYFNFGLKTDLSYRWTKRTSTVTSLALNSLQYMTSAQEAGSFYDITLGTEGRFQWSPRLTVLGELRYNDTTYFDAADRDSSTFTVLAGAEFILSRQLSASGRVGQAFRTFAAGGDAATSPYLEASVNYQYSAFGTVSWSTRLGFEESLDPTVNSRVLRTGLTAVQALGPRLKGNLGVNVVNNVLTSKETGDSTADFTFSLDAGLEYTLSRRTTFTASYSFTNLLSTESTRSFYRNQLFLGVQYAF